LIAGVYELHTSGLENDMTNLDVRRGDIWIVDYEKSSGHEQHGVRPAIVVSNDIGNLHSPIVEVVWLTTAEKKPLPTHVKVGNSTALCEQIHTVDKSRLVELKRCLNEDEMMKVNKGMMISLGIIK